MKRFWMVIGENDESTRDRCELLEVARTMANERAKQAPGRKFYILQVIESRMMTVPEIVVERVMDDIADYLLKPSKLGGD